jgi:hypothetical protein
VRSPGTARSGAVEEPLHARARRRRRRLQELGEDVVTQSEAGAVFDHDAAAQERVDDAASAGRGVRGEERCRILADDEQADDATRVGVGQRRHEGTPVVR